MTKTFCDICGNEALEKAHHELQVPHGKEFTSYRNLSASASTLQTKIGVSARFSFIDHPTGFGGPPDLCEVCILNLLELLLNSRKSRPVSK